MNLNLLQLSSQIIEGLQCNLVQHNRWLLLFVLFKKQSHRTLLYSSPAPAVPHIPLHKLVSAHWRAMHLSHFIICLINFPNTPELPVPFVNSFYSQKRRMCWAGIYLAEVVKDKQDEIELYYFIIMSAFTSGRTERLWFIVHGFSFVLRFFQKKGIV